MGTTYSIIIPNPDLQFDKTTLSTKINGVLKRVIEQMSSYVKSSSISKFNRNKSNEWIDMPSGIIELVNKAAIISKNTEGAYDITIAPVAKLPGHRPIPSTPNNTPNDSKQNNTKNINGYQNLHSRNHPYSLKKDLSSLTIDLSSIAKGYAVDLMGELFESQGIHNYLIEIGGELRTRGHNPRNKPWRIGIENPELEQQETSVKQALRLANSHIATSGDYRNYFENEGIRYSHTIDARTGRPISHHLASVTVAHSSTSDADGWATALMVLGEIVGFNKAVDQKIAAYFIYHQGGEYRVKYTPAFKRLLE